jgi:uncharacterized protein
MSIDKNEIIKMTTQYGGDWAIAHSRRLLTMIEQIGEGLSYDIEVIWLAAHLHDWGAYEPWKKNGIDHAERSTHVADFLLCDYNCDELVKDAVLDAILHLHSSGSDYSLETILLRDADALDFLGVVGIMRDFSKNPRDLKKAYQSVRTRREILPGLLHLEKAKELAKERVKRMDALLTMFEEETFGYF